MALDFPNSPTVGQLYPSPAIAGVGQWRWDGTEWVPNSFGGAVGAGVYMQDNAPTGSIGAGSLWFQTSTGALFIYFNDGNSLQWVSVVGNSLAPTQAMYVAGGRFQYVSTTQCALVPFRGDAIRIQGQIYSIPAGGVTLSNSGMANATMYNVYAYMSSGVMTLEYSGTTHVTDTTAGNVGTEIKSGDSSRTLVGLVRTDSSGLFMFTATNKMVRSWMNRQAAPMQSIALGSNLTLTNTFANCTGGISFVAWANETIIWNSFLSYTGSTTGNIVTTICALDGSQVGTGFAINPDGTGRVLPQGGPFSAGQLTEGFHSCFCQAQQNSGTNSIYSASAHNITLME